MKSVSFIKRLSFVFLSMSAAAARADSIVTINASKDTSIYESPMNNLSGGGAAGIYVGATGAGAKRRGLLAFDIAGSVPAGATITDVQLRMYIGSASSSTVTIGLHRLTKDWGEGTAGSSSPSASGGGMGFTASPGDATWADAKSGTDPWSGLGATGDFHPSASASTTVTGPVDTPSIWFSTSQLVSDVQSWLDTPGANFGWAIINANEGTNGTAKAFYSRSATQNSTNVPNSLDPTWRPTLTVTYVPEPAAGVLVIISSVFLMTLARCQRLR